MKKIVALFAFALVLSPTFAQSVNDLFQQALVMERSEGNLQEAISLYERVVEAGTDRNLAAKALIRIGENYERLGLRQARQAYQRVLDDYSDQQGTAQVARDRLSVLLAEMAESQSQEGMAGVVKRHVMDIPDGMGRVSPDGRYLSFVEWNSGNVALLNLENGEQTMVNSDGAWGDAWAFGDVSMWSRDGTKLLYYWFPVSGGREIRLYDLSTGDTRVLLHRADTEDMPFPTKWSDDGKYILAINETPDHQTDAIEIVDAETAAARVVKTMDDNWHTFGMDLSPDGKYIVHEVFESGRRDDSSAPIALHIASVDGTDSHPLIDDGSRNGYPLWDLKGENVLFLRQADDQMSLWALRVQNGRALGEAKLVFSGFEGNVAAHGITDDGRYFYARGVQDQTVYEQGFSLTSGQMHANTRVISSIRFGNQRAGSVSPSGQLFAFMSGRRLIVANLQSGESNEFDFPFAIVQHRLFRSVKWSSDNSAVLMGIRDETLPEKIAFLSVSIADGSYVKLRGLEGRTSEVEILGQHYSPDGASIRFALPRQLIEMDVSSGTKRVVYALPEPTVGAAFSPDGNYAAVVLNSLISQATVNAIDLVSLKDSTSLRLDESGSPMGYSRLVGLSWSADSKRIVFAENRENQGQQLYSIDIETGVKTAIGEPVFEEDQFIDVEFHPDGDKLTFTKGESRLELWSLSGIDL